MPILIAPPLLFQLALAIINFNIVQSKKEIGEVMILSLSGTSMKTDGSSVHFISGSLHRSSPGRGLITIRKMTCEHKETNCLDDNIRYD